MEDLSIDDILAEARPTERAVRICVRGDLRARLDEAEAALKAAVEQADDDRSLTGGPEVELAREVQAIRAEMDKHTRTFRFRSIGKAWKTLATKYADDAGNLDDAFFPAAVAASAVSPKMTPEQADRLFDTLAQGDLDALYLAARNANVGGSVDIPKSRLASQILARRDSSQN